MDFTAYTLEWDPVKNRSNVRQHGLSFDAANAFDWNSAKVILDDRKDYGEARFQARGLIGERLHMLVFTLRNGRLRIISLRKANRREQRAYAIEKEGQLRNT